LKIQYKFKNGEIVDAAIFLDKKYPKQVYSRLG